MSRRRSAQWPKPGLLAGLLIKHHLVHLHRRSGAATASRRDLVHRSVGPPQVVFRLTEDQVRAPVALAIDKQHHPLGRIGHFLEWSALSAAADCLANLRCEIVPIAIAAFEPRDAYIHVALCSRGWVRGASAGNYTRPRAPFPAGPSRVTSLGLVYRHENGC